MSSSVTPFSVEANGSKSGPPNKPNREKPLIAGIVILSIVLLAFIIAVIILAVKSSKQHADDVCKTDACLETALDLLHSMNTSEDPCNDFYKFACGNWGAPNSERILGTLLGIAVQGMFKLHEIIFSAIRDESLPSNVKTLVIAYFTCANYGDITEEHEDWLVEALEEVGGWPMTDKDWDESGYHWERNLAVALRNFIIRTPIAVGVAENMFDTKNRIIQLIETQFDQMQPLAKDRILLIAKKLSDKDENSIEKEYEKVEEFRQRLQKMSVPTFELFDESNRTKLMSVRELKRLIPWVNWTEFLLTAFGPYLSSPIHETEPILVLGIDYISKLFESVFKGTTSKRTLANYVAVSIIQSFLEVNQKMGTTKSALISSLQSPKNLVKGFLPPQGFSEGCFKFFTTKASAITDFLNYRKNKGGTVDEKTLKYFTSAMNDLITGASWLDDPTRTSALKKLHEIKYYSGFPERVKDVGYVEEYFSGLTNITQNPLRNQIVIERYAFKKATELLRIPSDRNIWPFAEGAQGSQVNAFNMMDLNLVVLPADIQKKPVYVPERPKFWNFGLFGWVIGHEITHGFDTSGSKRDEYGNLKNWWMPKAKEQFNNRARCLIEQYNKIPLGYKNHYINGTHTVGENVADNGGLRQAYSAYKKWEKDHGKEKRLPGLEQFNTEQLFFISVAQAYCVVPTDPELLYEQSKHDNHSPSPMRVNPAVANFDVFGKTFNCKSGSPMNPAKKCVVW